MYIVKITRGGRSLKVRWHHLRSYSHRNRRFSIVRVICHEKPIYHYAHRTY